MSIFRSNPNRPTRESPGKRLAVIQPHLSNASKEMFVELSQYCPLDLLVSPAPSGTGFGSDLPPASLRIRCFIVPTLKPFGLKFGLIQWGVVKYLLRYRPDAIFINANPRHLSFWSALFWARILRIPVYAHGHGFYRRPRLSAAYKVMMSMLLHLVTRYICYAPIVRQAFLDNGFSDSKLAVADNSLINPFPVSPQQKTGHERGVLFIGRLRQGCNIEALIEVIGSLREQDGLPLVLHIIGGGEKSEPIRKKADAYDWIVLHGEVYDPQKIRDISLQCFLGCYPGNAGLSIVHMMSLSLPVVTHDNLRAHGPEPSFIEDGVSGLLCNHRDLEQSLHHAIRKLASDGLALSRMQHQAFAEYERLSRPSLATRFWKIMQNTLPSTLRAVPRPQTYR